MPALRPPGGHCNSGFNAILPWGMLRHARHMADIGRNQGQS